MMINSVSKCMQILSCISDNHGQPLSLKEIAEKTDISKPTAVHILNTLIAEGYVNRISHSKGYVLGPSLFYLTRFGKYNDSFISVCHPVMRWLNVKTGHTVVLAVIHGGKKYIIDRIDSQHHLLKKDGNILTDAIFRTATGRVLLSNMHSDEVAEIYKRYPRPVSEEWPQAISLEALYAELSKISRRDTVATLERKADDESILRGYARALFAGTKCVGALGVAALYDKDALALSAAEEAEIRKSLDRAVLEINRRLKLHIDH
jgi:DNA-binding IclR family transcriptional regulator